MNKKITISIVVIIILIAGVVFWRWKSGKKTQILKANQTQQTTQNEQQQAKNQQQNRDEKQKFVVDVDSDVSHWQTKETEFFTIKFPKEWFWMESDIKKTGYHSRIITNNPEFDMVKYADIGVFTGDTYFLPQCGFA